MATLSPETAKHKSSICHRGRPAVTSLVFFLATWVIGLQAQTPPPLSIVGPTQVRLGDNANYTALVNGASPIVIWSVDGFAGGKVSYGKISSSGMYSPGNEIYAGHSVMIGAATASTPVSSASLTVKVLNQLPTLTGGSVTETASGTSFLLDVHGSNFVVASQLLLAGTDVATIFISSTELQSTISLPSGTATVNVGVLNPNAAQKSPVSRTLSVQLNAAVPTLKISSTGLAFGNVAISTASTQPVTLTSVGTGPVTVNSGTLNGTGFTMSGATFPVTLNPGLAVTLDVRFDPSATGAVTGQLTIRSNSSTNSMATISLSGTGNSSVTVSVVPGSVMPSASQSQLFAAEVLGTLNTSVTWTLDPAVGTISPAGLYTAPRSVTTSQPIIVTATSTADPTKTASSTITMSSSVGVALAPRTATLTLSQNQQFTATLAGTINTAVKWTVGSPVGTISRGGVYTAPASISSAQTVEVTATSVADPSRSASASITLAPPVGASYFVSNSGSDSNNGTTPNSPWQTIAHVNAQNFNPGDSILFEAGGVWREQLNITWTGSLSSPITFGSYGTGAFPIISGSNILSYFTPSSGAYYTPYTTTPKQVFRNGLRLYQVTTQGGLVSGSWWLDTANSRVWVYDNPSGATIEASQRPNAISSPCLTAYITLTGLQTEEAQGDGIVNCGSGVWTVSGGVSNNNWGSGVHLQGPGAPSFVTNYVAEYNGLDGVQLYSTPGLVVNGVTANYNVQQPGALYLAGIKFDPSSGTIAPMVEDSTTCHNGVAQPGYGMPSDSGLATGSGIWADTIGKGWIVRGNTTCGNNARGIDIDADNYAIVYQNVSYSNASGISAYADGQSSMTGHQIYNNTLWGNGTGLVIQGPDAGETSGGCKNNIIQNNISYGATSWNLVGDVGCENPGIDGSGNVYTYNAFGVAASTFVLWGGTQYPTYAAWEAATGNCGTIDCTHSMESDPILTDPSEGMFSLQSDSPSIGAGMGGVDLGAVPYVAR
jgi:Abnormal spindle-like microcephaly-assoc'd, ASPM-SPD-2-Hydin